MDSVMDPCGQLHLRMFYDWVILKSVTSVYVMHHGMALDYYRAVNICDKSSHAHPQRSSEREWKDGDPK